MNKETIYCFYCEAYQRLIIDYPVNIGDNNIQNNQTPRCEIHFQYRCDICDKNVHFNGISYCINCKKFTCIDCGGINKIDKEFLTYNYYYDIACAECKKYNSALDFAEFELTHPMQIGVIRPNGNILLWVPMNPDYPTNAGSISGETRMFVHATEGIELSNNQKIYDYLAELLEASQSDTILEIHCEDEIIDKETSIADELSKNTIDYKANLNILYHHLDQSLREYEQKQFDRIYFIDNCNIDLLEIHRILKDDGIFVFSIPHPCHTGLELKIPVDSHRIDDRVRLSDNSNNKISKNINNLISAGFTIVKLVELMEDNPIMIFKVKKL